MRTVIRRLTHPDWLERGEQPDYRFSLANERTFLAWVRTALALLAGAVAVSQLVPDGPLTWARHAIAIILAVVALLITANTYRRWAASERAMRSGRPLPAPGLLVLLVVTIALVGLGVLALVLFW